MSQAEPPLAARTPFLLFASQRSGSTFLVEQLRKHPHVRCLFEVLNSPQYPTWLGGQFNLSTHRDAMRDLPTFMARFWRWCPATGACGFKIFADHLKRPGTLRQLFAHRGTAPPRTVLLTRRDTTAQHTSLTRALVSGRWGFSADSPVLQEACIAADAACRRRVMAAMQTRRSRRFPLPTYGEFVRERARWHRAVRSAAAQAGSPVLSVSTEALDFRRNGSTFNRTMSRVLTFLRLPPFVFQANLSSLPGGADVSHLRARPRGRSVQKL